jgi:hypothetical protein
MDSRLDALEALSTRLESLLSQLDGGGAATQEVIEEIWGRCTDSFERFRDTCEDPDAPREAPPDEVNAMVEKTLRLYAVAGHTVEEWARELAVERKRLAGARAHLRARGGEARLGRSCDLSG